MGKISGGSAATGGGHTIRENGVDQTQRTGLNFVDTDAGAGLITDDSVNDETEVNLSLYALSSFKTIAVSGQSNVVADARDDTLTLAAGSNVTITTNSASDTITIAASGGSVAAKEDGAQVLAAASAFDFKGFNVEDGGSNVAHIYDNFHGISGFRLTLESGVPVSTTDQADKTTLYYTPYVHNMLWLYDGTRWVRRVSGEMSIALSSLTANKNYDVWVYDNSGTPTLELLVWTNDTTRATALTTQDGVLVKSGATTRLYVGTIRTTDTNKTQDTKGGTTTQVGGKRFVWNEYNRVLRPFMVTTSTNSWTYGTAAWRTAEGATAPANGIELVIGVAGPTVILTAFGQGILPAATYSSTANGIGKDRANTNDANYSNMVYSESNAAINLMPMYAYLNDRPAAGYHYYQWLELVSSPANTTFYSYADSGAGPTRQSGLFGVVSC